MHSGPVILNNTPLVALWVLNRLDLLQSLYDVVSIPTAVRDEFLAVRGMIVSVAPLIDILLENGLYLHSDLIERTLQAAGEKMQR